METGTSYYKNASREMEVRGQAIKRILVPIDGSEHSDNALEFAIDLARKYSAEIYLVHVISRAYTYFPMAPNWEFCPESFYMIRESEDDNENILLSALTKVGEAGIRSFAWMEYGQPAEKIVQIAREEGFDLIVMGDEDIGAIARFFLGSVSGKVSRHAPCPVLIVKGKSKSSRTESEGKVA